jgi:antitoxin component YwqK of YwqJK toxin-antitoxin module
MNNSRSKEHQLHQQTQQIILKELKQQHQNINMSAKGTYPNLNLEGKVFFDWDAIIIVLILIYFYFNLKLSS